VEHLWSPAGVTPARAAVIGDCTHPISANYSGTDVYLGNRPPLLRDFLDDEVAANVDVPAVQKMIVVQGMELTPLA
jgi:hypothetical protein